MCGLNIACSRTLWPSTCSLTSFYFKTACGNSCWLQTPLWPPTTPALTCLWGSSFNDVTPRLNNSAVFSQLFLSLLLWMNKWMSTWWPHRQVYSCHWEEDFLPYLTFIKSVIWGLNVLFAVYLIFCVKADIFLPVTRSCSFDWDERGQKRIIRFWSGVIQTDNACLGSNVSEST